MNHYTSLELSKKLKENGCELESNYWYIKDGAKGDIFLTEKSVVIDLLNPKLGFEKVCNGYDIANDILIRYAKEFFGEEEVCIMCGSFLINDGTIEEPEEDYCPDCGNDNTNNYTEEKYIFHSKQILSMLQQGKDQKEIEVYFWSVCKFNKKNKKE